MLLLLIKFLFDLIAGTRRSDYIEPLQSRSLIGRGEDLDGIAILNLLI